MRIVINAVMSNKAGLMLLDNGGLGRGASLSYFCDALPSRRHASSRARPRPHLMALAVPVAYQIIGISSYGSL